MLDAFSSLTVGPNDPEPQPAQSMLDWLRRRGTPWPGAELAARTSAGREVKAERSRSGPEGVRFPWFLPYFDEAQSQGETQAMRAAYRLMGADPNVKAALMGQILAVAQLDLQVQPADKKDPASVADAELVRWNFEEALEGGVPGLAWSVLSGGLIDGHSVCEKVVDCETSGKYRGAWYLRALKPKDTGRDVILVTDEYRNVTSVRGLRYNGGREFSPANFVIYSHQPMWGVPTGTSALRAVYSRWWMLDTILKLRAFGLEKRSLPVIWAEIENPSDRPSVEESLAKVRSQNWLTVPVGVRVQALNIAGSADAQFDSAISQLAEDILLGIAGATLQAKSGDVGNARGSSREHRATADLFVWHLSVSLQALLNDRRKGLVKDILDLNRAVDAYPKVTLSAVSDRDLKGEYEVVRGLWEMGVSLSIAELREKFGVEPPDPDDRSDSLGGKADQEAQLAASAAAAPGGPGGRAAADGVLRDETAIGGEAPELTGELPRVTGARMDEPEQRDFGKAQVDRQAQAYRKEHDAQQAVARQQGPPAPEAESPPARPAIPLEPPPKPPTLPGPELMPADWHSMANAMEYGQLADWYEDRGVVFPEGSRSAREAAAQAKSYEDDRRQYRGLLEAVTGWNYEELDDAALEHRRYGSPAPVVELDPSNPKHVRLGWYLSQRPGVQIQWDGDPPESYFDETGIDEPLHTGIDVDKRGRKYATERGVHVPLPPGARMIEDSAGIFTQPPRREFVGGSRMDEPAKKKKPFYLGPAAKPEDLPPDIREHLFPEEAAKIRRRSIRRLAELYESLPPDEEWAGAAQAGAAKRGWYAEAVRLMGDIFPDDGDRNRFVGLLAATSPRMPVRSNLRLATRMYGDWIAAGRPSEPAAIGELFSTPFGGYMPTSHGPNVVRALSGEAGGELSGQKVESFRRNLSGDLDHSTNDVWMANFSDWEHKLLGSKSGYLAMTAKVRKIAKQLGWKPAEVQETIWSYFRELARLQKSHTAEEAIDAITHEGVEGTADFATLMLGDPDVEKELRRIPGLWERVEQLRGRPQPAGRSDGRGEREPLTGPVHPGEEAGADGVPEGDWRRAVAQRARKSAGSVREAGDPAPLRSARTNSPPPPSPRQQEPAATQEWLRQRRDADEPAATEAWLGRRRQSGSRHDEPPPANPRLTATRKQLEALPGRYGQAVRLRVIDGYSIAEVAETLGVSPDVAEAWTAYGLRRLRQMVRGQGQKMAEGEKPEAPKGERSFQKSQTAGLAQAYQKEHDAQRAQSLPERPMGKPRQTEVSRNDYEPINPIDRDKADSIATAMRVNGWQGPPLLAVGGRLLTGSHRQAAARRIGLDVPVLAVDPEAARRSAEKLGFWEDGDFFVDDHESWAAILDDMGDEEAAALFRQEMSKDPWPG